MSSTVMIKDTDISITTFSSADGTAYRVTWLSSDKEYLFDYVNVKTIAEEFLKEQRQKDLKSISFHFAIPFDDLEKALKAKPFEDIDLELPQSSGGDG